jgi:hypothetical protein
MSDRKATLTALLVDSVSGPGRQIQATVTGIGAEAGKMNAVLQGVGQGIGQEIFLKLSDAIGTVTRAIPALIDEGNAYLEQLHLLQLETGMTAEQASTLVGVMKNLGVPTDALDVLMSRLGKNLATNEKHFRALGVATQDANGNNLDAYTIIGNLRNAVAAHGESLLSTAAAVTLFGKSAYDLLPYLQATDAQIKDATDNVNRWGGVFNQAAINASAGLGRTLDSLRQGITDIGAQIAAAVDPYLRTFVDAFAKFVQSHLQEIVNFAVSVVNVVTGFVSGILGITDALGVTSSVAAASLDKTAAAAATAAKGYDAYIKTLQAGAGGTDAFSKAIDAHIKAIGAETQAIQIAQQQRQAVQERARLQDSLSAAQAQLSDLRGNAPFTGGLSSAEAVLAVQKHAQDILDAEKNVKDQRVALGNFEADQKDKAETELLAREKVRLTDSLASHKAADKAILDSALRTNDVIGAGTSAMFKGLALDTAQFGKSAESSFQVGIAAANSFLDVLLGAQQRATDRSEGLFRTGGVVGALQEVGDALYQLGSIAVSIAGQLARVTHDLTSPIPNTSQPGQPGVSMFDIWAAEFQLFLKGFVPHRAGGGPVMAGGAYTVGENGPETLLMGGNNGTIVPNGGGGGVTVIVNADFISQPSDEQVRSLTDKISRAIAQNLSHAPVTSKPFGAF